MPMKVKTRSSERLVLAGVPGGFKWMIVLTVLGAALTAAAVWFGFGLWQNGMWLGMVMMGLGVLIAQALFWTGLITLIVGRERLELDLVTQRGRYDVTSPIIETGSKPFEFDLATIHSIAIERSEESRPGSAERMATTAQVVRARLRTVKPRRAVILDETENGRDERVRALAEAVGEFLGLEVVEK